MEAVRIGQGDTVSPPVRVRRLHRIAADPSTRLGDRVVVPARVTDYAVVGLRRMGRRLVALCLVCAALAGGAAAAAPAPTLSVKASSFGPILFDGRGFVLYGFTRDPRGRSACVEACARAWPPYIVKSRPRAGGGATARLIGTTRRADGSLQVTYARRPLYYYVGDRKPGQILCQNVTEFGGVWRVVRPSGRLVG